MNVLFPPKNPLLFCRVVFTTYNWEIVIMTGASPTVTCGSLVNG